MGSTDVTVPMPVVPAAWLEVSLTFLSLRAGIREASGLFLVDAREEGLEATRHMSVSGTQSGSYLAVGLGAIPE